MTVGDADKIWHPQFFAAFTFRVPTFDQDSATADPSYDLRHSVKPRGSLGSHLAHSMSDGIAEEVEAVLREAFGSLSSSPPAEKHVRIGLSTEAREGPYNQDEAEHFVALSDHLFEGMKRLRTRRYQLDLCCVFLTIAVATTLWHTQLFSAITFESRCFPELLHTAAFDRSRVTANGTEMFELADLVNLSFGSHAAYSPRTCHLPSKSSLGAG